MIFGILCSMKQPLREIQYGICIVYTIFFGLLRRTFSPQIWEENEGVSYSPNVAYLACWGLGGRRWWSGVTGAGSPLQEAGSDRSGVMLRALGWEQRVSRRCKAREAGVPAAAYYSAREEGTDGAGMLGEERLRHPYVSPSHDWCVPH